MSEKVGRDDEITLTLTDKTFLLKLRSLQLP